VKLADEAEGPSPLWNGSTCKRQCYGEDQVTVYPRMPQDRAGCVARYTQAEEVREGGIPEATEIYCQSELAKNEVRPVSFTRAASLSRSRLQTERKNREGSHAAMPHRQIIWWLPQEKDTWGGRQLTMAGDAQTLQASL